MSLKTIIVLVVTAFWFWGAQYRYTCVIKNVCGDEEPENIEAVEDVYLEAFGPLTYKYNDQNAYTSPTKFEAYKKSILEGKTEDNILEITGYYFKDETTPEGSENMGEARAKSARALFGSDIPGERVRILTKEVETPEDAKTNPFKSVHFKWIVIKVEKAEVIQLADRAVMFFPVNSTGMVEDPAIGKYFTDVAANIKISGEKIKLTGHTDNTGNETANHELGLRRATAIKNILISKGVDKNLISIESKGESQPVATNDTDSGRHQNRRVELRLIKQ
jgi:OmpA-OmpF porin, OOP family